MVTLAARHTWSAVFNSNQNGVLGSRQTDVHRLTKRSVFDCVVEEIENDLSQSTRIHARDKSALDIRFDLCAANSRERNKRVYRRFDLAIHCDRLDGYRSTASML